MPAVSVLISAGANVNKSKEDGSTALMIAAYNGLTSVVRILISAGAALDEVKADGSTRMSAALGHADVVRMLINSGADVTKVENTGRTALMLAEENGHSTVARLLRQCGTRKTQQCGKHLPAC